MTKVKSASILVLMSVAAVWAQARAADAIDTTKHWLQLAATF